MPIIRLEDKVPEYYVSQSRDMQMLLRLLTAVEANIKFNSDSIEYLNDPKRINDRLIQLLQTKVGFFTKKELTSTQLRYILDNFQYLIKRKGTENSIVNAILLYFQIYKIETKATIEIDNENYYINIGLETQIKNIEFLTELLKYLIPTGYILQIFFSQTKNIDTNLYNKSSLKIYVVSKNEIQVVNNSKEFSKNIDTIELVELD